MLAVIAFHAFPGILPSGFIGVDVFFVISGYLISSIIISQLAKQRFSVFDFYSRRIRRIFPALAISLSLSYALGWLLLSPPELASLGKHVAAGAAFISNFVFNSEAGYFDAQAIEKPMLHLWSLSIEEQFYLIWPLALILCFRLKVPPLGLVLVGIIASFVHEISLVNGGSSAGFFLPTGRFWELMTGALISCLSLRRSGSSVEPTDSQSSGPYTRAPRRISHALSLAGAALLLAGFALVREGQHFPGWWALFPVVSTGLLIAAGPAACVNRLLLSRALLVAVGLISYPLYLLHWPLLSIAYISSMSSLEHPPSAAIKALLIMLTFGLSWAIFQYVEKPMRRDHRRKVKVLFLTAAMVGLSVLGYRTFTTQGFADRQSALVQSFYKFRSEHLSTWRAGSCFQENSKLAPQIDYDKCTTISPLPNAPKVLLWGDSTAAHLYPGLHSVYADRITLTQITLGRCAPTLQGVSDECRALNQRVLDRVKQSPPDIIILAAACTATSTPHLPDTLQALKAMGVKKIILMGRPVEWVKFAPLVVARSIQADPLQRVRRRYRAMVKPEAATGNDLLRKTAQDLGVSYVSPYDVFCNEDGCLAVNGDSPEKLVTIDYYHLGTEGSRILAEALRLLETP